MRLRFGQAGEDLGKEIRLRAGTGRQVERRDFGPIRGRSIFFIPGNLDRRVEGNVRAGAEEIPGQGLAAAGDDLGIAGEQAVLSKPLGRSQDAVDRVVIEVEVHFGDRVEDPGAGAHGPEGLGNIALGGGGADKLPGRFLVAVEVKQDALLDLALQFFPGPGHFQIQAFFVPEQRRDGEAVALAEIGKGGVAVQKVLVDGRALGVPAGFAFHGRLRFLVKAKSL